MNVQEALDKLEKIYRRKRRIRLVRFFTDGFNSLKYGIKNILFWFPVIWKDRQFDHGYLYTILGKKLELMEAFFLSDDTNVANAKKYGKQIKIARILCNRLETEDYSNPNKWADWKYADRQEKQDREYLFDLMKKKVPAWWD
ncbi:MAG: hypothetical protein PHC62_06830 [Candidatus Izemoplasmatales bacterium]|nr:hypothetical protein [Candidatus Izemoplasmatales bacterium]